MTSSQKNQSLRYDAENRLKSSREPGALLMSYDAEGRRVKKINEEGGETLVMVYDAEGRMVAEYSTTSGSQPNLAVRYLTTDHLGSTRVVTGENQAVKVRRDYTPYGEEIGAGVTKRFSIAGYGASEGTRQKFTSKERDGESGLDYLGARYYSSADGRFTSPDEFAGGPDDIWLLGSGDNEKQALPYAEIANPQSLNKYQYTFNNPLRYIDPSGHQAQDDWWSRLTRYIFGTKTQVVIDEDRTKEQQKPKLLGLDEEKMIEKHREVLIKTNEVIGDVIEFLDPTGATTVIKEHMKGNADGVVIAIVGMTLGGKSSVTFGEAKKLVGAWAKDPVEKTISASIKYHYGAHGAELVRIFRNIRKNENKAP